MRNANDASHNDVNATLWHGRMAWTREYGSGKYASPVVYTKDADRSALSTLQAAARACRRPVAGTSTKVCGPTTDRNVEALELWGDNLAVTVNYSCKGCSGIAQRELRLDNIASSSGRRVALLIAGLNGQQFVGLSFFDGRLAWYRACAITDASCRSFVGPWRYRLSSRGYQRGTPGPIQVGGFADTGSRLFEVVGCFPPEAEPEINTNCRIDQLSPPSYSAVPAPL